MDRRDFLTGALCGSAVACLPASALASVPTPRLLSGHRRVETPAGHQIELEPAAHRVTWRDAQGRTRWTLQGAPPNPDSLNYPVAAAFVPSTGLLHIVDRGWACVHTVTQRGQRLGAWGRGLLQSPGSIARATQGDWFIADAAQRQVLRFSASGRLLGRIGGQELRGAGAIALDREGQLHVADTSQGCMHRYQAHTGRWLGRYAEGGWPSDVAVDATGAVWVANAVQGELRSYRSTGQPLLQVPLAPGRRLALESAPQGQLSVVELA